MLTYLNLFCMPELRGLNPGTKLAYHGGLDLLLVLIMTVRSKSEASRAEESRLRARGERNDGSSL